MIRTGLWKCRDGSIARVGYIYPPEVDEEFRVIGDDGRDTMLWDTNGRDGHDGTFDLVEFLTASQMNPRDWIPPVVVSEGLWLCKDGRVVLVEQSQDGWSADGFDELGKRAVFFMDGNGRPRGKRSIELVERIGDNPLRPIPPSTPPLPPITEGQGGPNE